VLCGARSGSQLLSFVRSHGDGIDSASCGNRAVDALVSSALFAATPSLAFSLDQFDTVFQIWLGPRDRRPRGIVASDLCHVAGDPRSAVFRHCMTLDGVVFHASRSGLFASSPGFLWLGRRVLKAMRSSWGFLVSLFTGSLPCFASRHAQWPSEFPSPACRHCGHPSDDLEHLICCPLFRVPLGAPPLLLDLLSLPAGSISVCERFGFISPDRLPHLRSLGVVIPKRRVFDLCIRILYFAYDAWISRAFLYRR
jgi:hypothetical protein